MNDNQPQWFDELFARSSGFMYACKICGAMTAGNYRQLHARFHGRKQPADPEPSPARTPRTQFPARDGDGKWTKTEP